MDSSFGDALVVENYKKLPEYPFVEQYFEQCDDQEYNKNIRDWYDCRKNIKLDDSNKCTISYTYNHDTHSRYSEWIYERRKPGPGFQNISNCYGKSIWIRIGDPELHRMADYGESLNANKWKCLKTPEIRTCLDQMDRNLRYYLLDYLVVPKNDPEVLVAEHDSQNGLVSVMKKYGSRYHKTRTARLYRYKGMHPITVQHKWLRTMAQVCRSWNKHVKEYRILIQKKMLELKQAGLEINRRGWLNFLDIEKKMTKNQSKHRRAVKKTKKRQDPIEWKFQVAINTAKRDVTQRANAIRKWHRRIIWYQRQLAARQPPPSQIAYTYQTTLDYLQLFEAPTPLGKKYVRKITANARKVAFGVCQLSISKKSNDWKLVTSKRGRKTVSKSEPCKLPLMTVPPEKDENLSQEQKVKQEYDTKLAHIINKLAQKRERRYKRFLERSKHYLEDEGLIIPASVRLQTSVGQLQYDQKKAMKSLEKKERARIRQAEKKAARKLKENQ
jgi:hypothetical protein